MLLSIIVLFFLLWIDTNPIKSIIYRSTLFKVNLFIFVIAFMILGWLGVKVAHHCIVNLPFAFSQVYFYFLYFYISIVLLEIKYLHIYIYGNYSRNYFYL